MDEAIRRFRREADHELGDRRGAARRYSVRLRQTAVACWRRRERIGDGVDTVAAALGVAPVSLRRWAQDARFRPVEVVPDVVSSSGVSVVVEGARVRVDGLDIDTAAQLIARLR